MVLTTEDSQGKPISLGSGFFVRDYIIATNYHVVKGASRVYAKHPSSPNDPNDPVDVMIANEFAYPQRAYLAAVDEQDDLALLVVYKFKTRPLALAKNGVAVGDPIYVAGNPEGLEGTFSQGIVSALRGRAYVQITAPISHGSSGGPVLNSRGEVVGVATVMLKEGQNLNFAIPVPRLVSLLAKYKAEDEPDRVLDRMLAEKEATAQGTSPRPQPQPSPEPQPSLEETISWLKDKLEGSERASGDLIFEIPYLDITISQAGPPPHACTMYMTRRVSSVHVSSVEIYEVILSQASEAQTGRNKSGESGVWLYFPRGVFYREGRETKKTDAITLFTRDEDLAERVAKAFNHVIKLCGGGPKKEPF